MCILCLRAGVLEILAVAATLRDDDTISRALEDAKLTLTTLRSLPLEKALAMLGVDSIRSDSVPQDTEKLGELTSWAIAYCRTTS